MRQRPRLTYNVGLSIDVLEHRLALSVVALVGGTVQWTDPAGDTHPIRGAKVHIVDATPPSDVDDILLDPPVLADTVTNDLGRYAVFVDLEPGLLLQAEVAAESDRVSIKRYPEASSNLPPVSYQLDSPETLSDPSTTVYTLDVTASTSSPNHNQQAFVAYAALNDIGATYAQTLLTTAPPQVVVNFGAEQAVYLDESKVINLPYSNFLDWDVLLHEYGHFVQQEAGIADFSPPTRARHSAFEHLGSTYGKETGDLLAWKEGWASFFAISAEQTLNASAYHIETVGDSAFDNLHPSAGGTPYSLSFVTSVGLGEDEEIAIAASLYHLFNSDAGFAISDSLLFNTFRANGVRTMGQAWDAIASQLNFEQRTQAGTVLALQHIAPLANGPDGATVNPTGPSPTFTWSRGGTTDSNQVTTAGANDFAIKFFDSDFTELLYTLDIPGNVDHYQPNAADWKVTAQHIFGGNAVNNEVKVNWIVAGKSKDLPETPGAIYDPILEIQLDRYWSNALTLKAAPLKVSLNAGANFVAGGEPRPVLPAATVVDFGANLASMTVALTHSAPGSALLSATAAGGVSVAGNGTATLTLSGNATDAAYQAVLQSVKLQNNSIHNGSGVITVVGTDAREASDTATTSVAFYDQNFAVVTGRKLFYKNSPRFDTAGKTWAPLAFSDDNAIATDKSAYLPNGSGGTFTTTATFANISSYDRGINGIMVDISGLHGPITADDFIFKVGNNNTPSAWALAPAPLTVLERNGGGASLSDRIELIWADYAIKSKWLEVIVRGNDAAGGSNRNTGLPTSDIFFFGNAVGDTGLGDTTVALVDTSNDEIHVRNNTKALVPGAAITNIDDFNRDGVVDNVFDALLARNNTNSLLTATKFIKIFYPVAAPDEVDGEEDEEEDPEEDP